MQSRSSSWGNVLGRRIDHDSHQLRRRGSDSRLLADAADLDDDQEVSPYQVPALSSRDLTVARSVADKFIIRCLLDDGLRPLYGKVHNLMRFKAHQVEAILVALRFGAHSPKVRIALGAHRGLLEEHLGTLRAHLEAAAREHALLAEGSTRLADAEELAARILSAPNLPLALLPPENQQEVLEQASALARKGGSEVASTIIGGVELAPFQVPIKRRRQMLGCVISCSVVPAAAVLTAICLILWRRTWPFLVAYLPWALLLDRSPWRGGKQPWHWLRRSWFLQQFAEYFPASLIKANPEADFSGSRPVLMGYHPHGILSFGAVCNFGTDTTGWAKKFPELTPRICTLNMNMKFPFLREILARMGCIAASRDSIKAALKPGNAVIIVVGGAAEALDTKPGEYVLVLARRSGFFRLALEHGADLVPTFGFGENDIFDTFAQPGTLLRRIQLKLYKVLSFSTPVFYGRNVFTYNMGPLPYRRPLTVVVGDPIRVEQQSMPTQEDVESLKTRYIASLRHLYEEWQPRLEPGREAPLMVT